MAGSERVIADSARVVERGAGVRFEIEQNGNRLPAFAVRVDGIVRGYVNVCAHQGLQLDWTPARFFDPERVNLVCDAHGARYDPADGSCTGGPCRGRGLEPVRLVERDGRVLLIE